MVFDVTMFVVVLGVVVGCAIWGRRRAKRRANAIRAVADELGLTYFPKADPAWMSALSLRERLSLGSSNVLYGQTEGVDVRIFDWFYATEIGPLKWPRLQSIVSFHSSALSELPDFALRPDTALHRIATIFGYKRIEFESHPGFSQAFLLRGSDEARIRQLFDDEVLEFFEQMKGVYVDVDDNRLLFHRRGVRVQPAELRWFMAEGFEVYLMFRARCSAVPVGHGTSAIDATNAEPS